MATIKHAIDLVGGAITLGYSYGGFVIAKSAYNNLNVTGLVYIAKSLSEKSASLIGYPCTCKM